MALPPGFLDELRDRTSLSAVVGRKVTWDLKKSNQAKGDWWAPCPFHQEKTASFHVDDRKGFYYCFGCQSKGNVFSFLTEAENMPFMEAVEMLARDAGMEMPARDPRATEQAEKRRTLSDVMEHAVAHYRLALTGARGRTAREYLAQRGLSQQTIEQFEIGFAADSRTDILETLKKKGVAEAEIIATGLAIKPDDGGAPYDRFRGRIMFPIRDARGRCISFGGRAMDPNARAKYLNGPETELFDKGRQLYNHGPAREASGKSGRLIVAEGYMDVIALAQAGFREAVAPLGTAVTEDQLQLLWRINPEPIIALDGDAAGLRAARKVMDLALPHLAPERALRFLILPQGQDPDDVIRSGGPDAFEALLGQSKPLVDVLWERETEGRSFDSPERRAALDASLRKALGQIPDQNLRRHYGEAIREKRAELFGGGRSAQQTHWQPRPRGWRPPPMPTAAARASALATPATDMASRMRVREAAILFACFNHPSLALDHEDRLERLHFVCEDLSAMRTALLSALGGGDTDRAVLKNTVEARLTYDPLERLTQIPQVGIDPHLAATAEIDTARTALTEIINRHEAVTGMHAELAEGAEDLANESEALDHRIAVASAARDRAMRGADEDGVNPTVQKENLSETLSRFIDDEIWVKKTRG
ncbi:MAG: DNA primase [Pseudomonadota bacterium]